VFALCLFIVFFLGGAAFDKNEIFDIFNLYVCSKMKNSKLKMPINQKNFLEIQNFLFITKD